MYIPAGKYSKKSIIRHPLFNYAIEKIEQVFNGAELGTDRRCILITGPSGAGKTSALEFCSNKYLVTRVSEGVICPVLSATVPSRPTVKGLATTLLYSSGEPILKARNETQLTIELGKKISEMKVKAIVLDEFQHFCDQGGKKIQHHVADWLKVLVDQTKVGLVVSGLPHCKNVIETNPQLKRRFQAPINMDRFDWSCLDSRAAFIDILGVIQEKTILKLPDLTTEAMAYRWYCATGGLIGRVANLLFEIDFMAKKNKSNLISLHDLEVAAKQASYDLVEKIGNPFNSSFNATPSLPIVNSVLNLGEYHNEYISKPIMNASEIFRRSH